jgi:hypothetical protein
MSEQSMQKTQPAQNKQELRQQMLEQLEVSKKAIEELSDKELEEVAGGMPDSMVRTSGALGHQVAVLWHSQVSKSAAAVLSASGSGLLVNNYDHHNG